MLQSFDIPKIQHTILERYLEQGRDFPWRATRDPYAIHISEVMSQQTQIERVLPYREKWMQIFPDYGALAQASKLDLLAQRSGLGFNSRALRLQSCAQEVVHSYGGKLPKNKEQLLQLPGIGAYTAGAICSFAWNLPEPVIDTNIRRVLIFLFKLEEDITLIQLEKIAKSLIPEGRSRDRHNALMDYGALHLTAKKTKIKSLGKQSAFKGSDREVRGWVIKRLVNNKIPLSIALVQQEFPHKNIKKILQAMANEGLIHIDANQIRID